MKRNMNTYGWGMVFGMMFGVVCVGSIMPMLISAESASSDDIDLIVYGDADFSAPVLDENVTIPILVPEYLEPANSRVYYAYVIRRIQAERLALKELLETLDRLEASCDEAMAALPAGEEEGME